MTLSNLSLGIPTTRPPPGGYFSISSYFEVDEPCDGNECEHDVRRRDAHGIIAISYSQSNSKSHFHLLLAIS